MDDNFSDDSSSFIVLLMAKDDGSHYNDGHGWNCGNYSGGEFDLFFFLHYHFVLHNDEKIKDLITIDKKSLIIMTSYYY